MFQDSEYESFATIAVNKLVMMPTTCLAKKGSSPLVDIKNKEKQVENFWRIDAWKSKFCLELKKI